MDAFNFLDIQYASFTGLGWFNYQSKKGGGYAFLGALITIIKE